MRSECIGRFQRKHGKTERSSGVLPLISGRCPLIPVFKTCSVLLPVFRVRGFKGRFYGFWDPSKSRGSDTVSVRPRPAAPYKKNGIYSRSFYILLLGRDVRGDLSPSFVNLPLRQISAEGIPLFAGNGSPWKVLTSGTKVKQEVFDTFCFIFY